MKRLFSHHGIIRHNLLSLIGVSLCLYFSYHLLQGDRSALRLMGLNSSIATLSQDYYAARINRVEIEEKVLMMRPGSLNKDLLEERVRFVLGYTHENDFSIFDQ